MAMGNADWLLELALILLLAATLFHAIRLERALGVLKRDRTELEKLVVGFNASTQQAEAGITRLRAAADSAGKHIAVQIDAARSAQSDLEFMIGRGERLADRIDNLVRSGRDLADASRGAEPPLSRLRSQAERDLLKALKLTS